MANGLSICMPILPASLMATSSVISLPSRMIVNGRFLPLLVASTGINSVMVGVVSLPTFTMRSDFSRPASAAGSPDMSLSITTGILMVMP